MNDITALAQRMKAAAEKAIADEGQTWWSEEQLASDYGLSLHPADAKFIALASHENVKALVEALEKAQEITAAAEKLVRCKGRYHSEQNYRALAALFGVKTPDLPQLESESRTVTVKLPKRSVGEVMHMSGFSRDYAEGWCSGNDNAINEMKLAGIQVIEGEG